MQSSNRPFASVNVACSAGHVLALGQRQSPSILSKKLAVSAREEIVGMCFRGTHKARSCFDQLSCIKKRVRTVCCTLLLKPSVLGLFDSDCMIRVAYLPRCTTGTH